MGSVFSKHRRTTKEKGKTNVPVPDVQPSNGIDTDHEVTADQLLTASFSMPGTASLDCFTLASSMHCISSGVRLLTSMAHSKGQRQQPSRKLTKINLLVLVRICK